jgi:hypothetical protein
MKLVLLLTLAATGLGTCSQDAPTTATVPTNAVAETATPPASVVAGRYTIIHSPLLERDTMLLDTATGRTWQLVNNGPADQEVLQWQPVARYPNPDPN